MDTTRLYDQLAALFEYPGKDYAERVSRCAAALAAVQPDAASTLEEFCGQVRGRTAEELQEHFIQTFDLNPDCSLELGWHLFGENYDRGTYLVKLRGLLRRFGLAETHELPDHVTYALALLGRMPEAEAEEFAIACVLPALQKIRAAVKKENSFHTLLEVVAALLGSRFAAFPLESIPAAPALRVLNGSGLA
ncbi:MAG: molecular chaperone TorD family protein [Acidobacteria bacterium]|nr:molecular chaperone TorD family protein [Acidobacteriota bacterium]